MEAAYKIKKTSKKSYNNNLKKWPYIFVAPFIICYLAFFAYPIMFSFYISLFRWNIGEKMKFIGLKNYVTLVTTDPYFLKSVGNTFIIMFFTIPIVICLGLFIAELLFNEQLRWKNFFRTVNFLPYITTPVAVSILFSLMLDPKIGIINLLLVKVGIFSEGLDWMTAASYLQRIMLVSMIVWEWVGYYMLMYLAGMSSISSEVYEAAKVDGADRIKTFFKITLPLLKNVTFFLVITSVIYMLQLLDQPFLLTRGLSQGATRSIEKPLMTVMTNFIDQSIQNGRLGFGASVTYGLFIIIFIVTFAGVRILKIGREEDEK